MNTFVRFHALRYARTAVTDLYAADVIVEVHWLPIRQPDGVNNAIRVASDPCDSGDIAVISQVAQDLPNVVNPLINGILFPRTARFQTSRVDQHHRIICYIRVEVVAHRETRWVFRNEAGEIWFVVSGAIVRANRKCVSQSPYPQWVGATPDLRHLEYASFALESLSFNLSRQGAIR